MNPNDRLTQGSQRRLKRDRATIQSDLGDLTLENEELTEISPDGGEVTTTVTRTFLQIDGEIIHDILTQIGGQCQEFGCSQYLTQRTVRICGNIDCNKMLCHHHAKFYAQEDNFFCRKCYRSIRIKRFFLTLAWIILFPFVEREY